MEDEIDLGQLLRTLWRGKIWIVLAAMLFLIMGAWYAFKMAVPIYTAKATVALESREQTIMDIESVMAGLSGDQSTINTEVEVIRSRILIERLVRELDLVNDPEFNWRLREPSKFTLGAAVAFVRLQISGPPPPLPAPSERKILDSVIDSVRSSVSVSNIRNSLVFNIGTRTKSPQKSTAIANTLADLYIEDQVKVKFAKTEQATKWLGERVAQLQIALELAEENLKRFSRNTDLVSPEGLIALNRQLKEFRERRDDLEISLTAQQTLFEQLAEAAAAKDYTRFAELANDQAFSVVLQRASDTQLSVVQAQAGTLLDKKTLDIVRAKSQLQAIGTSITNVTQRIGQQSDELVKLQQLQREAEANRLIYEAFLGRLKETSIQQGIQQADSRVISRAVVPDAPVAPQKSRILALSLMLGIMFGAAGLLLREMSQNTFRTAEDLEAATKTSVLAQIPIIPARSRKNVIKYLMDKPNSGAAEAIRNLRTSLLLANVDKNPQIILSTSSVPGEGKTTQSIALALNFAQLGESVLLIEGDIRRRVFTQYFTLPSPEKNFLSVLSGNAKLDEVIYKDSPNKFDILLGESSSVNAADLFSSDKFAAMLEDLRSKYDRIIIDTPPVLAVPDTRVIGQRADAIVYSVKWDSTSQRQVLDGLKSLETVNLRVSGLALVQINKRGMKKYGYGDSYGNYQGYYES